MLQLPSASAEARGTGGRNHPPPSIMLAQRKKPPAHRNNLGSPSDFDNILLEGGRDLAITMRFPLPPFFLNGLLLFGHLWSHTALVYLLIHTNIFVPLVFTSFLFPPPVFSSFSETTFAVCLCEVLSSHSELMATLERDLQGK